MKRSAAQSLPSIKPHERIDGVRVGKIIRVDEKSGVSVDYAGNPFGPLGARFVSSLKEEILRKAADSSQDVLLVFENNDPSRPVVIDTIASRVVDTVENDALDLLIKAPKDVTIDGERIRFNAREQIEIKCGKASITLTRSGKVLIRGAYLLNRSSGVNRIYGGSVQIN
jgi:hypothetical protein